MPSADSSPLQQLQVQRAGSSSLLAEWRWTAEAEGSIASCHILFVRTATAAARQPPRRLAVSPSRRRYAIAGLVPDSRYRVCLQYTLSANYTRGLRAAGRQPDMMECVDASTKRRHVSAGVGCALGALLALLLVLGLLLLSRRRRRYRKISERQTSSKKVVQEMAYQANSVSSPKRKADSSVDAFVYDGSDEQQSSSVSDDALTPPSQPPPPPPPPPPSAPPTPPPLATPSVGENAGSDESSESREPPESVSSPSAAPKPDAGSPDAIVGGRQVIQVNETDEYSIDLRHCDSLSRQQSLKTPSNSSASTSACEMVRSAHEKLASNSVPRGPQCGSQNPNSVPSLYTQLIETL